MEECVVKAGEVQNRGSRCKGRGHEGAGGDGQVVARKNASACLREGKQIHASIDGYWRDAGGSRSG